jgi:hypothetical protein
MISSWLEPLAKVIEARGRCLTRNDKKALLLSLQSAEAIFLEIVSKKDHPCHEAR